MNIATALKAEISRVARKEVRRETESLKQSSSRYRSEIAALKVRLAALERSLKALAKPTKAASVAEEKVGAVLRNRFSASGLAKKRAALGLSAEEMGRLLGVSGQSIYKWEQQKATPRPSQLPAIRSAMKLGKRAATARLSNEPS